MTDYYNATDEMFGHVTDAWADVTMSVVGYLGDLRYAGKEIATVADKRKHWARVSTQTVREHQTAFGDRAKRYTTRGLLFVQLFSPKLDPNGADQGRQIAEGMKNCFRGKQTASSVLFQNARIQELQSDDDSFRWNVVTEYQYDYYG